ncbi:hypothetical protein EVAR_51664_1 [Eumeta japonica]|uniref:Uncharacterized protein n=1 Tax=Eumeta variegata TaxID=151549 RepID=A0A4C1YGZ6_EUMVA|nr:hypothetical protein EVAR_51664_1 [Eumeta japonica]
MTLRSEGQRASSSKPRGRPGRERSLYTCRERGHRRGKPALTFTRARAMPPTQYPDLVTHVLVHEFMSIYYALAGWSANREREGMRERKERGRKIKTERLGAYLSSFIQHKLAATDDNQCGNNVWDLGIT